MPGALRWRSLARASERERERERDTVRASWVSQGNSRARTPEPKAREAAAERMRESERGRESERARERERGRERERESARNAHAEERCSRQSVSIAGCNLAMPPMAFAA